MLQPSLSLSEEYSDNFDLTKTDRHSNFRTAIAPTLLFSLDSAFTKGIIAYTFTANHDSFQNDMLYFHSVLGQVSWQATPTPALHDRRRVHPQRRAHPRPTA